MLRTGSITRVVTVLALGVAACQPPRLELLTTAEATDFVETSRYQDVVDFLAAVDQASDKVHLTTLGTTSEGRAIPLAVVGDVPDASAESVKASGKLRIYLQGNIHGGEVPGKEALQILLRGIVNGDYPDWSDQVVLLVAPIYNADGNESVAFDNRPNQNGPVGGMGRRPNAQGYDLNRDHMKLDSPEARGVASMMTAYDPHLSVDLHTTNGTRHAYHVTYSPPLHPGTHPALIELLRGEMLPELTETIRSKHGQHFYYYGNAQNRDGERAWVTFDHRPRFNNNYVGLRNRLAILSEAYAYLTFEDRVYSTLWFVEEILAYSHREAGALASAVQAADASIVGQQLPTRATFERSAQPVTILMGEVDEVDHPNSERSMLLRRDVEEPTEMYEYGTFSATDTEVAPARYLVPGELADVLERLGIHGVVSTSLAQATTMSVEEFAMDSIRTSPRPFQGHQERTLFGAWRATSREVPAGTSVVEVDQSLGRLAFYLLEPRADDGFANWGLLDEALEGADVYPILRVAAGQ